MSIFSLRHQCVQSTLWTFQALLCPCRLRPPASATNNSLRATKYCLYGDIHQPKLITGMLSSLNQLFCNLTVGKVNYNGKLWRSRGRVVNGKNGGCVAFVFGYVVNIITDMYSLCCDKRGLTLELCFFSAWVMISTMDLAKHTLGNFKGNFEKDRHSPNESDVVFVIGFLVYKDKLRKKLSSLFNELKTSGAKRQQHRFYCPVVNMSFNFVPSGMFNEIVSGSDNAKLVLD
ncbi:unnamed protein product [Brassica rapa]|uniref:Uncharacterized protein n=1 Tax=Brassica campestris TaxID=3711 RepID=A0A8D9LQU5_BRACM|nr:unnamed protein product [Brassica rapa]